MTYIEFKEDNLVSSVKKLIECRTPAIALSFCFDCVADVLDLVPSCITNLAIFIHFSSDKTGIKIPASVTHLKINNRTNLFNIPSTVKHLFLSCKYTVHRAKISSETIVYTKLQRNISYTDRDGNMKATKSYDSSAYEGCQAIDFGYDSVYIDVIEDDVIEDEDTEDDESQDTDIIISDEILERLIQKSEAHMNYVCSVAKQLLERLEQLSESGKLHRIYGFSISLSKNMDEQFIEDLRTFVPATKIQLKISDSFLDVKVL